MTPYTPTDYSNSPMDPERIRILQDCERSYINGVPDEEGNVEWPTYRSLAAKHLIPIRVINEQAAKHRWNARRDRRRGQLVYFKQQQQMRQWQEMDRDYTLHATEAINKLQFIGERKIDEMYNKVLDAHAKDADARRKGSREVHEADIKMNDYFSLVKTITQLNEAQAARANRAQMLPLGYEDVASPSELPTAVEEQAQLESSETASMTKLEDILMMMVNNRRRYDTSNEVVEGELDEDDDDGLSGVLVK